MEKHTSSKELFLANQGIKASYFDTSIKLSAVKNKVLRTREQGKVIQSNIFYRPKNIWINRHYQSLDLDTIGNKILENLKDKLYASLLEATGPLVKNNKVYGIYTEYIQLIPYTWAQNIPLQRNPFSLEKALEAEAEKTPAYKFDPDPNFIILADKLNQLSSREVLQELNGFIKHEISEVRVNKDSYMEVFYGGPYDGS